MKFIEDVLPDYDRVEARYQYTQQLFNEYYKKLQIPLISVTAFSSILFYSFNEYLLSKTKKTAFYWEGFNKWDYFLLVSLILIALAISYSLWQLFMAYSDGFKGYSTAKLKYEIDLNEKMESYYNKKDNLTEKHRFKYAMSYKLVEIYNEYLLLIDDINGTLSKRDDHLLSANRSLFIIFFAYVFLATIALLKFFIDISV